jgi:hypothetical protein
MEVALRSAKAKGYPEATGAATTRTELGREVTDEQPDQAWRNPRAGEPDRLDPTEHD